MYLLMSLVRRFKLAKPNKNLGERFEPYTPQVLNQEVALFLRRQDFICEQEAELRLAEITKAQSKRESCRF